MASKWMEILKKYFKEIAAEKKAGKFKGNAMKEAIKRAKAEYSKTKGTAGTKEESKEDNKEDNKEEENKEK